MPTPLWFALGFLSLIVVGFIFAFADSGERALLQGLYMGSVVALITSMLLLLSFLDDPFQPGIGGLQPTAMERTVDIVDEALLAIDADITMPCDDVGQP